MEPACRPPSPVIQRCQSYSPLVKGAPRDHKTEGVYMYLYWCYPRPPLTIQPEHRPSLCVVHFLCGLIQPQAATGNGESEELSIDRHKYLPSDAI